MCRPAAGSAACPFAADASSAGNTICRRSAPERGRRIAASGASSVLKTIGPRSRSSATGAAHEADGVVAAQLGRLDDQPARAERPLGQPVARPQTQLQHNPGVTGLTTNWPLSRR
jgi:hypothetical protein